MIKYFKNILITLTLLLIYCNSFGQEGYEINVKVRGYKDSTMLLTSYFGQKIRLIDTAYAYNNGEFTFRGEKKLPGGIYMAVSANKRKLFEFIVSEDQKFSLETDTIDYVANMSFNGTKNNMVFFDYLLKNEAYFKLNKSLSQQIDSLQNNDKNADKLISKRESINLEAINSKLEVINENSDLFVSSLLNSMRELEIPDTIINSADSVQRYVYYRDHFFDYIDLSDSCLLRTPIYMRKVKKYFDQLVVFNPDSVIAAIDIVIKEARPSQEVIGYLVWYFVSEYQNPKYMGFDKVFVHLVDEYFSKEDISNTTESILESLQERADKIRPILIDMPAPQLLLVDTLGTLTSFEKIQNKYTILFFWDSDCGICGKEIVELNKTYSNSNYDIEVYAINVNGDLEKWKKAIRDKSVPGINVNGTRSATRDFHDLYDIYGTPVIYVLDGEKNIIAKRIGADKLEQFIDNYEKRKK
jgi:peroxiredoxin/macrodomain Ter protein organizer (MatP/YcbG family)